MRVCVRGDIYWAGIIQASGVGVRAPVRGRELSASRSNAATKCPKLPKWQEKPASGSQKWQSWTSTACAPPRALIISACAGATAVGTPVALLAAVAVDPVRQDRGESLTLATLRLVNSGRSLRSS